MTPPTPGRVFVLERYRIAWAYVAKSGCSSLLHMLSEIGGSPTRSPDASPLPECSPEMVIHDARVHGLTPVEDCRPQVRRAAMSSPDWWRFAVVRDPHSRFLSAWTDKVFLRAPGTPQLWGDSADVLTADGCIDVTATFERFVRDFEAFPARLLADRHFLPQDQALSLHRFTDLEIIPLSRFAEIPVRLGKIVGRPVAARRFNESIHFDPRLIYCPWSHAKVATVYRKDLGCDPAAADTSPLPGGRCVLTPLETEMVRKLRAASSRIRQLVRLAILPDATVWLQRRLGLR